VTGKLARRSVASISALISVVETSSSWAHITARTRGRSGSPNWTATSADVSM
jgi:hypothetical protein